MNRYQNSISLINEAIRTILSEAPNIGQRSARPYPEHMQRRQDEREAMRSERIAQNFAYTQAKKQMEYDARLERDLIRMQDQQDMWRGKRYGVGDENSPNFVGPPSDSGPPETPPETPPQTPPPSRPPDAPPSFRPPPWNPTPDNPYFPDPSKPPVSPLPPSGDGAMASAKKSEYYTANPMAKDRPQSVMAVANQLSKMAGPSPLRSRPIQNRMA